MISNYISKRCPANTRYSEQKKVTRNGTEESTQNPWKMETMINFSPDALVMMGSVVSIEVAPPTLIGANLPKYLASSGAQSRVSISLQILASRAMVPSSGPRYSVIKMLESE